MLIIKQNQKVMGNATINYEVQEELNRKDFDDDNYEEPRTKYWKIIGKLFSYCLKPLVISSYCM